jgi:hypothetical protein
MIRYPVVTVVVGSSRGFGFLRIINGRVLQRRGSLLIPSTPPPHEFRDVYKVDKKTLLLINGKAVRHLRWAGGAVAGVIFPPSAVHMSICPCLPRGVLSSTVALSCYHLLHPPRNWRRVQTSQGDSYTGTSVRHSSRASGWGCRHRLPVAGRWVPTCQRRRIHRGKCSTVSWLSNDTV